MKKNILVIEKESLQLDVYGIALEVLGYNVFKSNNSFEGLKTILNSKIDLILCDIEIENNLGFKFISLVKSLFPKIEVIMIEKNKSNRNSNKALTLGYGYLVKPFSVKILSKLVNDIFEKREENICYLKSA